MTLFHECTSSLIKQKYLFSLSDFILSFVKGWEISAKKDACIFCKKQAEKKYAKEEYPRTPIHLGCRCTVMTA